ncbi:MAG: DUF1343 domain-containing protein [Saprospiraceae bacterium]|nr:DUF1343 domain-containing protein [Saprospiraceae bacterium]
MASAPVAEVSAEQTQEIIPGADRLSRYVPMLMGKRVGLTVNHSSVVGKRHLVDTLRTLDIQIARIFAPEHGFRGTADAGEHLQDQKDPGTGLPVISLYGNKRKPSAEDLAGIDIMVFDIQDVGVRFYTYISTLHLVMEACVGTGIPVLVLDRPNPNGYYIDGPVLDTAYRSFVGMHPIPVVYGLTIGELAQMINGERWLAGGVQCDLTVVPCVNYDHTMTYTLPVAPSPNLPNLRSILLYPSLCWFEPTTVSVGRGTDKQFQVVGHPSADWGDYAFVPEPKPGASSPKHQGVTLTGHDLSSLTIDEIRSWGRLHLTWLLEAYVATGEKERFFANPGFFDKLAGTDLLRTQIMVGADEDEIRRSWSYGLEEYKQMRKQYLLYPDFE